MTEIEKLGMDYIRPQLDRSYEPYGETKMMELTRFNGYDMLSAFEEGSKVVKNEQPTEIPCYNEQDIIKAIEDEGLVDDAWGYKTPTCIWIYTEGMEKEIWEKYPTPLHGFEKSSWAEGCLEPASYFLLQDYSGNLKRLSHTIENPEDKIIIPDDE